MSVSSSVNPSIPPETRIITPGVRPPRVAIFIDRDDPQWMHTILRVIEWSTMHWGGWYTCVVPTDGKAIAGLFWTLLEAFDPDYLYTYQKTGIDRQIIEPEDFQREYKEQYKVWLKRFPDQDHITLRQACLEDVLQRQETSIELSKELKDQLYTRLNPFSGSDKIIHRCAARPVLYEDGLTSLQLPFKGFAGRPNPERIEKFIDIEMNASLPVQLMVHSLYGKLWEQPRNLLRTPGSVHIDVMYPHSLEDIGNLVESLWYREQYLYEGTTAAASLLKCSFYHPVDTFCLMSH